MSSVYGHITAPKPFWETLSQLIFKISGWSVIGEIPDNKRLIIIFAYHTSNWDFVYLMGARFLMRMHVRWFAKHTLFKTPFAAALQRWGGIPVKRHLNENLVTKAINEFSGNDYFAMGMAPEGTRSKVNRWKTGFYHIAIGANANILPVALDYKHRHVVIGAAINLTGIELDDFNRIYNFFNLYEPLNPELACHGEEHIAHLEEKNNLVIKN